MVFLYVVFWIVMGVFSTVMWTCIAELIADMKTKSASEWQRVWASRASKASGIMAILSIPLGPISLALLMVALILFMLCTVLAESFTIIKDIFNDK